MVALFTTTHPFFYLIGPFSFFYLRSILRDNSKLSKRDLIHFGLFAASFSGIIPFLLTSWDFKIKVAQNIQSNSWDMAQFHINKIIPHKVDQLLNVLQIFYYTFSHWVMLWKYRKRESHEIMNSPQYKLIRKWLITFCSIFSLIAINFCFAMAFMWIYDDKNEFLERTSVILFTASSIYVAINMLLLALPQIMYGLPIETWKKNENDLLGSNPNHTYHPPTAISGSSGYEQPLLINIKSSLQLFSVEYIERIEQSLTKNKVIGSYLNPDFNLTMMANDSGIPAHHLTYYFNTIRLMQFSDWRNSMRIEYAKRLIDNREADLLTLQSIATKSGFSSQSTFIRSFKQWSGTTPSEYMKKIS